MLKTVLLLGTLVLFVGAIILLILTGARKRETDTTKRLEALATKATAAKVHDDPAIVPRTDVVLDLLPERWQVAIGRRLTRTGNRITVQALLIIAAIVGAAVWTFATFVLHIGVLWTVIGSVGFAIGIPWQILGSLETSQKGKFLALFPDAIELAVRAVRAGLPVTVALDAAGREVADPVGGEFKRVIGDLRIGIGFEEALHKVAERIGIVDFDFFVACLVLQRESGGNLSETLGTLASVLRKRGELRAKTKAMTAEARMSAWVLGALPFVVAGTMMVITPDYFGVLLTDPRGGYFIGAALGLISIGGLSMRTLIQKAQE